MPETTELHTRLMQAARNYDASAHHRGLLAPYRDVLLLWRAKFMSYEQIAATLTSHGIKVSPAGIGAFCRTHFTKSEIDRARHELRPTNRPGLPARLSAAASPIPVAPASTSPTADRSDAVPIANRRGPKIARDNY